MLTQAGRIEAQSRHQVVGSQELCWQVQGPCRVRLGRLQRAQQDPFFARVVPGLHRAVVWLAGLILNLAAHAATMAQLAPAMRDDKGVKETYLWIKRLKGCKLDARNVDALAVGLHDCGSVSWSRALAGRGSRRCQCIKGVSKKDRACHFTRLDMRGTEVKVFCSHWLVAPLQLLITTLFFAWTLLLPLGTLVGYCRFEAFSCLYY